MGPRIAPGPVRIAGSTDIPRQLVPQLAGDSVRQGSTEERLKTFQDLYELLLSKGYSDNAAQQAAQDMVRGEQPMARSTTRFAGIQGLPLPREL